jgi:peptide deformylase
MAALPIRIAPEPVLRQKAKRVKNIDASIERLINDMVETMQAADGVGLAAPQVGVSLRVIVIRIPEEEEEEIVALINPEIVKRSGERLVVEGCLSIPGYRGEIKRSVSVTVKGRDHQGKEVRLKANELLAQALEHEIDHLNGVLYIDHLESPDKLFHIEPEAEEGTAGL